MNKSRAAKPRPRVSRADGSGNVETQVYHAEADQGGRAKGYIDEVIILDMPAQQGWCDFVACGKAALACQGLPHGRVYVHQDANWNVTALTDLTGRVLERNWYSPYGEVEVSHEAHFFDFDADGDIDDDDLAAADTNGVCRDNYAGAGGDCKRLDADADGDVDGNDNSAIGNYTIPLSTIAKQPRKPSSFQSTITNRLGYQGATVDPGSGVLRLNGRSAAMALNRYLQPSPRSLTNLTQLSDNGYAIDYTTAPNQYIVTGPGDYCSRSRGDYVNDPGWARDWPGISDVVHCGIGVFGSSDPPCTCFRQVTAPGQSGGHVCFRRLPPPPEGPPQDQCFDPHNDSHNCCVKKNTLGACSFDMCACVSHWWHDLLGMP